MTTPDPWSIAIRQIAGALPTEAAPARFNPRPAGVIQRGSATHRVLAFFQERPRVPFARHQIMFLVPGLTAKSVDWALLYLRSQNLIEGLPMSRNHYRLVDREKARHAPISPPNDGVQSLALDAPQVPGAGAEGLQGIGHEARKAVPAVADKLGSVPVACMASKVMEALASILSHGPLESSDIKARMREAGFTAKQVRLARERLGIVVIRTGSGRSMRSNWSLPDGHTNRTAP